MNIGPGEVLVLLVVALVVLGPERLPGAARQVGGALREVRRVGGGFESELRDALHAPLPQPTSTPRRDSVPDGEGDAHRHDGLEPSAGSGPGSPRRTPDATRSTA
jgi:Tat protein translocase TatB subunit